MTQNELITDVIIIGAGPAGCASAIELANQGLQVIMLDKAKFPRDKCCGDGLTTDALRILEDLGLKTNAITNWNTVTDAVIFSPNGLKSTVEFQSPPWMFNCYHVYHSGCYRFGNLISGHQFEHG